MVSSLTVKLQQSKEPLLEPNGDLDNLKLLKRNDIREIKTFKQLEKLELEYDSPRLKKALQNLGLSKEECLKKYNNPFYIVVGKDRISRRKDLRKI